MEVQKTDSVKHRKARVARDGFDARVMSQTKAFRLSLAKAADVLYDLDVTITTIEQIKLKHADIQKEMGNDGLLILLDGHGGARGVIKFDMSFLAALIEVQTTGKVSPNEAIARPVTRTDAAIVAPLVNAFTTGFDQQMATGFDDFRDTGFAFGDMAEDARAVSLVLVEPEFDLFRISVDIAEGQKPGCLTVLIPVLPKKAPGPGSDKSRGEIANSLERNAMNAPIVLDAAMARILLPLKEIWGFKPGQQVALPIDSMTETLLLGAKGHVVSEVKLGKLNGWRAVRFISGDGTTGSQGDSEHQMSPQAADKPGNARAPATGASGTGKTKQDGSPPPGASDQAGGPGASDPDQNLLAPESLPEQA